MNGLRLLCVVGCLFTLVAADAPGAISFGYNPIAQTENIFNAQGEGFFAKNGLNISLAPLGANGVAAIAGGSIPMGSVSTTGFLQAVDNGLDLVVVGGCGVTRPGEHAVAILERPGVNITKPADLVGKRVGVPGIGLFLHVLAQRWLKDKGVDPSKVTWIEVPIPNTVDALKSGSVDAIVAGEPFLSRAISTGVGKTAFNFTSDLPAGIPYTLFISTRSWAKDHPKELAAFRTAIRQGAAFVTTHPDKTREYIAQYTTMPLNIVKGIELPTCKPIVDANQLTWIIDSMVDQKLLQKRLDPKSLLAE